MSPPKPGGKTIARYLHQVSGLRLGHFFAGTTLRFRPHPRIFGKAPWVVRPRLPGLVLSRPLLMLRKSTTPFVGCIWDWRPSNRPVGVPVKRVGLVDRLVIARTLSGSPTGPSQGGLGFTPAHCGQRLALFGGERTIGWNETRVEVDGFPVLEARI